MNAGGVRPENEILSLLAHRLNLPNSWRHINPESVKQLALRQEIQRQREEASRNGDFEELAGLYEQENTRLEDQIRELKGLLDSTNRQIKDQHATIDQLEFEVERLKSSFQTIERASPQSADATPEGVIDSFLRIASGSAPTPSQCLHLVSHFFPESVVICDSAWKSADKSAAFKHGQKALALLTKLATDYREDLLAGKGDALARRHFGNAYAAKESESVENNKRARQARTFPYKGNELGVSRHLRIGGEGQRRRDVASLFRVGCGRQEDRHFLLRPTSAAAMSRKPRFYGLRAPRNTMEVRWRRRVSKAESLALPSPAGSQENSPADLASIISTKLGHAEVWA